SRACAPLAPTGRCSCSSFRYTYTLPGATAHDAAVVDPGWVRAGLRLQRVLDGLVCDTGDDDAGAQDGWEQDEPGHSLSLTAWASQRRSALFTLMPASSALVATHSACSVGTRKDRTLVASVWRSMSVVYHVWF